MQCDFWLRAHWRYRPLDIAGTFGINFEISRTCRVHVVEENISWKDRLKSQFENGDENIAEVLLVFVRICERNQRKKLPLATSTLVALVYKNYCVICTKKHFVFPIPLSITFCKIHFQYSKDYVPLPTCSIIFFLTFLNVKILTYLQNLFARLRYKLGEIKKVYIRGKTCIAL